MASPNVEKSRSNVHKFSKELSALLAVSATVMPVFGLAVYQSEAQPSPETIAWAKDYVLAGAGLGVTSLVAAWTGKGFKNPVEMINSFQMDNPRKILKKAGELEAKNPDKALSYMKSKLGKMSLKQHETFSNYIKHDSKMSQLRNEKPNADQLHVSRGKELFRMATLDAATPRRHYSVGYDVK